MKSNANIPMLMPKPNRNFGHNHLCPQCAASSFLFSEETASSSVPFIVLLKQACSNTAVGLHIIPQSITTPQ